ncbi:MAG: bifunctional metallophosphatase/5'-nucleotidase [Tissierellia bacterium]|nr:bifunctional metallophosphatase/5'-nucleotidase [Tissierellia bacterium]
MKTLKYIILIVLLFVTGNINVYAEEENTVEILFTHDLHDHIDPYKTLIDGEILDVGGYQRLYEVIKNERDNNPDLILLDGGDYSMGTLYQTIYTQNPSLELMGYLGYDATTLGNHEFDFLSRGLSESLNNAANKNTPEIVNSNIGFDKENKSETLIELENAFNNYPIKDYIILDRSGYKVGVFGLMGDEAAYNSPTAEVEFLDRIEHSKRVVKVLKDEEKVDMVICLSHSGTSKDEKKSEDEILAREVPEIDFILSGHTHTTLSEPIIVSDTIIGSTGSYGRNIGKIVLSKNDDRWKLNSYELIPLIGEYSIDEELENRIAEYKDIIQSDYLNDFNLDFDEIIAYSPFNFTPYSEMGRTHSEFTLTNLFSDAYIHAVKNAERDNHKPITAAIVPDGTVRDSFVKGVITTSDVFNANSLGVGPDGKSGYPLISVYLTGEDLKTAIEVDASIGPIKDVAQLYMAGVNYSFNPNRMIFNKTTDAYIVGENGERIEIDNEELYRVVAGLYTAQMLSIVKDESFGIMSIIPRDENGIAIENFNDHIIYNDNHEVKEWLAVAEYFKSFPKEYDIAELPSDYIATDGIPVVPEYYSKTQNRKVVEADNSLGAILSNPNSTMMKIYGLGVVLVIGIGATTKVIIKRKRKKRKAKNS